jgi:hypothetical protein
MRLGILNKNKHRHVEAAIREFASWKIETTHGWSSEVSDDAISWITQNVNPQNIF